MGFVNYLASWWRMGSQLAIVRRSAASVVMEIPRGFLPSAGVVCTAGAWSNSRVGKQRRHGSSLQPTSGTIQHKRFFIFVLFLFSVSTQRLQYKILLLEHFFL
ncbi:hypothetical protein SEVIR_1G273300v4 [Setaria viridis]|uniref:Uncharacterized protein n=1 Tax=Setaria viridis TaxID=4556 RepID=A0A4U6WF83_SETVI|nr:hypothetical protein SEVIR_1G273300v2 [Setaria viridis]